MLNRYQKKLSEVLIWDPEEEGLTPPVDFNQRKAREICKQYIIDQGYEQKFLDLGEGETLYQCLKKHFLGELMLMVMGVITVESLLEKHKQPDCESGMKPAHFDEGVEWMRKVKEAHTIMHEGRGTTTEINLPDIGNLVLPDDGALSGINALLSSSGLSSLEDIFSSVEQVMDCVDTLKSEVKGLNKDKNVLNKTIERQSNELSNLLSRAQQTEVEYEANEDMSIPEGKLTFKPANEVFPEFKNIKFDIPFYEWEGFHPDVPKIDPNYIFREDLLKKALFTLVTNQRGYLQGHTGTGKTTLLEQIAAHINKPFGRINFDSDMQRVDLIGRDTLSSNENGEIISTFVDGLLPRLMQGPYLACFDEIDFVRPDVGYVMQSVLEGNGLMITEDGGRVVRPHPDFRMFATGNTVGQGDEFGMYQGARPQSIALLDRFTVWMKVPYLEEDQRNSLVLNNFPSISDNDAKTLQQYVREHLIAFENSEIVQPISPRGMLAIARATVILGDIKEALQMTVLDKANAEDHATLRGLVNRVTK